VVGRRTIGVIRSTIGGLGHEENRQSEYQNEHDEQRTEQLRAGVPTRSACAVGRIP
jgi:hypothetical protein